MSAVNIPEEPLAGESAGFENTLSNYAGPYVTDMLAKGAALADMPYNAYTGPLSAGASPLQEKAFTGYGALDTSPTTGLGSFSAMGAPAMGGLGSFLLQPQPFFGQLQPNVGEPVRRVTDTRARDLGSKPARMGSRYAMEQAGPSPAQRFEALLQTSNDTSPMSFRDTLTGEVVSQEQMEAIQAPSVAAQYMNPYLQAALDPQLREARRQADVSRIADASRLTKAGAFGGSRQAIMESEGRRNLGQLQSDITAKGYADAFEKARSQFNEEERRRIAAEQADRTYGLSALEAQERAGMRQRDIEQEGITADYLQFEKERKYPYEQLAFRQSLLSGLPLTARQESYIEPSGFASGAGDLNAVIEFLQSIGIG